MRPFLHSFNRRCNGHDYRSRCIYMITILKSPSYPVFSYIAADPASPKISPVVTLSPVGEIIYEAMNQLCVSYTGLKILRRIAMPDHIHFELFVTQSTGLPLGSMIAAFKSICSKEFRVRNPESALAKNKIPMFEPGFNDKIAFRAGSKDAFYNYIADNPRRYLVKKLCADYFYHKLMIEIEGMKCGLYGNLFLLDNPVKSFVKISRDKSKMRDLDDRMKEWDETIRCGGVLVSPFINPAEKEIRAKAIENGNGLIIVLDYRFSERTKPYKSLFDLCAEGRLLIISTEEFSTPPKAMHYSQAQKLNGIASAIAKLAPSAARLSRR